MHGVPLYCMPMDRFVARVSKPTQNVAVLGDHLKSVAPNGKGKKRGTYKAKPHNWSPLEKEETFLQLVRAGLKSCKLLWADECPPRSTLEEWATNFSEQGHINPLGCPRAMQEEETAAVVHCSREGRLRGSLDANCPPLPPQGAFGQQLVAKGVALKRPWAP